MCSAILGSFGEVSSSNHHFKELEKTKHMIARFDSAKASRTTLPDEVFSMLLSVARAKSKNDHRSDNDCCVPTNWAYTLW
jgi:hypothetical protein